MLSEADRTGHRLDWIFDSEQAASLEERYDTWAATYDSDHGAWGWRGPDLVAAATLRHIETDGPTATIVDAGCGTGMAGVALRTAGWSGRLVGLDLSHGMLDQASRSGVYDTIADAPSTTLRSSAGSLLRSCRVESSRWVTLAGRRSPNSVASPGSAAS